MATETNAGDLRERISTFLMRNFPQIAMHGGEAAIEDLDEENGVVWIRLGGMCSGCGISPMTIQAIKHRMVVEIPEITEVNATAGFDFAPFGPGDSEREYPDVPF